MCTSKCKQAVRVYMSQKIGDGGLGGTGEESTGGRGGAFILRPPSLSLFTQMV